MAERDHHVLQAAAFLVDPELRAVDRVLRVRVLREELRAHDLLRRRAADRPLVADHERLRQPDLDQELADVVDEADGDGPFGQARVLRAERALDRVRDLRLLIHVRIRLVDDVVVVVHRFAHRHLHRPVLEEPRAERLRDLEGREGNPLAIEMPFARARGVGPVRVPARRRHAFRSAHTHLLVNPCPPDCEPSGTGASMAVRAERSNAQPD